VARAQNDAPVTIANGLLMTLIRAVHVPHRGTADSTDFHRFLAATAAVAVLCIGAYPTQPAPASTICVNLRNLWLPEDTASTALPGGRHWDAAAEPPACHHTSDTAAGRI